MPNVAKKDRRALKFIRHFRPIYDISVRSQIRRNLFGIFDQSETYQQRRRFFKIYFLFLTNLRCYSDFEDWSKFIRPFRPIQIRRNLLSFLTNLRHRSGIADSSKFIRPFWQIFSKVALLHWNSYRKLYKLCILWLMNQIKCDFPIILIETLLFWQTRRYSCLLETYAINN